LRDTVLATPAGFVAGSDGEMMATEWFEPPIFISVVNDEDSGTTATGFRLFTAGSLGSC
jgi:hypothetical protein